MQIDKKTNNVILNKKTEIIKHIKTIVKEFTIENRELLLSLDNEAERIAIIVKHVIKKLQLERQSTNTQIYITKLISHDLANYLNNIAKKVSM